MPQQPRRKRWIKLWTQETLYGTTSRELKPDERGVWFQLLCLAGDSPSAGKIVVAPGVPYTTEQLYKTLNISEELLKRCLKRLEECGKIKVNSDTIEITNWERYQGDFARTEYMREYMQQYRKTKSKTNSKTANSKTANSKTANSKTSRTEEEEYITTSTNSTSSNNTVSFTTSFTTFAIWEECTGRPITGYEGQVLGSLIDEYSDSWVSDSIREAANHGRQKVNLRYIEAVLRRWQEEGKETKAQGNEDGIGRIW